MSPSAGPPGHAFGPETLPYGAFSLPDDEPRIGVRLYDNVLDLSSTARRLGHPQAHVFAEPTLNALMELGPTSWREIHTWVRSLLPDDSSPAEAAQHLLPLDSVTLHLPFAIADYVDFYASESHASNVGKIFRPDSPALPQSWKHLPIGYHGRAGTVVVSGTDVVRPSGQRHPGDDARPQFGPTTKLDIECEVGFVVGRGSDMGSRVSVAEARRHIFGVVLLNDWSARDIQAWEYVPLGPFLGKSFATSISAWVVPFEALHGAELPLPRQDPAVLPYLDGDEQELFGLDLHLSISVNGYEISHPEFRDMYWSPSQLLAHLTVNGASLRVGDLFASGTVSGAESGSFGSLLELTWNGTRPISLDDGTELGYLVDGDVVTLTGWAPGPDGRGRVTLGEVTGRVVTRSSGT